MKISHTHKAARNGRVGTDDATYTPANAPNTPPASNFNSSTETPCPALQCNPPPSNDRPNPKNTSVATTSAVVSVVVPINASVPSAPAPADENPTSIPIGSAISG